MGSGLEFQGNRITVYGNNDIFRGLARRHALEVDGLYALRQADTAQQADSVILGQEEGVILPFQGGKALTSWGNSATIMGETKE